MAVAFLLYAYLEAHLPELRRDFHALGDRGQLGQLLLPEAPGIPCGWARTGMSELQNHGTVSVD